MKVISKLLFRSGFCLLIFFSYAVVAKSDETGPIRSTTTGEDGSFLLASLSSDSYTVYLRVPGFKTFEQRARRLNAGQITELTIKLEVGEVSESVSSNTACLMRACFLRPRSDNTFRGAATRFAGRAM